MNWALTKHFPGIYVCHLHKTTMRLSPLEIRRKLKYSEVKKLAQVTRLAEHGAWI